MHTKRTVCNSEIYDSTIYRKREFYYIRKDVVERIEDSTINLVKYYYKQLLLRYHGTTGKN